MPEADFDCPDVNPKFPVITLWHSSAANVYWEPESFFLVQVEQGQESHFSNLSQIVDQLNLLPAEDNRTADSM